MKVPRNLKVLVCPAIIALTLIIFTGCKKTNNSPSYYFTAVINGEKTNFGYKLVAARNSPYGSPDSNLVINGWDSSQQSVISIRVNSTPNILTPGKYQLAGYSFCSYQVNTLAYQGTAASITINKIDSSVVQGSISGILWRPGSPDNILIPITGSFNIRISN
jgi:hypothetical protein